MKQEGKIDKIEREEDEETGGGGVCVVETDRRLAAEEYGRELVATCIKRVATKTIL